jgi:hypothetical protein
MDLFFLCPVWSCFARMLYSLHWTSKDLFFCVLCGHVSLVQDVILPSLNFNAPVLLCPVWSCFAICRTLYSLHWTPKDLFLCVLYGHVLLVQDVMLASWNLKGLVMLCLIWLCFASAGRYALFMEVLVLLCLIWSCFVMQDVMLTS